jgi:hypothetical protein
VNVSGQGEHDQPLGTVYEHDPAHGPSMRPIPHRRSRVINAATGEELSSHITDVRAIQNMIGGRTATHVVEIDGEPFWGEVAPADTVRGYRRTPGTGRLLPSMYQRPDAED